MSTLKTSDPCSDIILDFIAGGVPGNMGGESGGNYDAVIGNAKSTRDLNVMSLQQIYALQAELLAEGKPSSAIGRYQDISATLRGLVATDHLPPTTIFTEELEDRLNVELMNSACRYQDWRASKVTDAAFLHLIACQWASLPDPQNGGKSRYDGVGPNHASTTLTPAYAMLTRAKAALGSVGVSKVPPVPDVAGQEDDITQAINLLQTLLQRAGFYMGALDSDPGPQTLAAITAWRNAR